MAGKHGEKTKVVPERFHGKPPNKLSELTSTKYFGEDPRNWEETLDEYLKDLSDKYLKADILEMLRKHQEMWKGHLGELKPLRSESIWNQEPDRYGKLPIAPDISIESARSHRISNV